MDLVDTLWGYILVFLLAAAPFFEAYGVIPLAMIAGLSPMPVIILGLTGNIATVLLVIIFINKIKEWRQKKKEGKEKAESKRGLRARKLWKKYGLPGLAIIGPLLVGSHLTAVMCLTFGGSKKNTAYWMIGSIVLWSLTFAILVHFGIDLVGYEERNFFE